MSFLEYGGTFEEVCYTATQRGNFVYASCVSLNANYFFGLTRVPNIVKLDHATGAIVYMKMPYNGGTS